VRVVAPGWNAGENADFQGVISHSSIIGVSIADAAGLAYSSSRFFIVENVIADGDAIRTNV